MKRHIEAGVLVIALVGTVLFHTGCATGKGAGTVSAAPERVYASHKKIPSWISTIPEDREYLYYVGTSTDAENFDSGKKVAIGDALSQVVATIGIRATSTASYEERYFAEEYTTTIESELLTEGKAKLQDAEINEIYHEQWNRPDGSSFFRVWLLLKYSREEIAREQERLAEIMRLKYGEVDYFENLASEYARQYRIIDAVSAHLSASASALKIDDGEVFFDRNIIRASELLLQVRLRKFGDEQVGWVGTPLDDPLGLQLYYLEGEREIPVPNAPVRFAFRIPKNRSAGYKWTVTSAITDQEGKAFYRVSMIHEVSTENRVDVRIDLSAQMSQLEAAPSDYRESIEAFKSVLNRSRATYFFSSDTRAREIRTSAFFLQFDDTGSVILEPVAAASFNDVLFGKGFSLRGLDVDPSIIQGKSQGQIWDELDARAAKGVRRIIFGTVRIVEYDTISGYETATAAAEASVLDRETGEIIRAWQIQRSGTGGSRDAATMNALTQIGRSLGEIVSNTIP
jgi:hypothetical protein